MGDLTVSAGSAEKYLFPGYASWRPKNSWMGINRYIEITSLSRCHPMYNIPDIPDYYFHIFCNKVFYA